MAESPLQLATRHVLEGERHVAKQRQILENLERDGYAEPARQAREMLAEFEQTLADHREHLKLEQEKLSG
jgi:hypothetical protein